MNFHKIFEEVVTILHYDYAGCLDKRGCDSPHTYREELAVLEENHQLDAKRFVELVNDYLLDFKDHHMAFILSSANQTKAVDVGFKVRRFEDSLYIYYAGRETRVKKGMRIQSIDQLSIPELAKIHQRKLAETNYERQKWGQILTKYKTCQVVDENGRMLNLDLKLYEQESYVPEFSLNELNSDILLMKITDFFHPDELHELVKINEDKLNQCKNLIIDVRLNRGGDDSSYYGLLNYIVDRRGTFEELFDSGSGMLINCTERNFETKAMPLINILDSVNDPDTKKLYEAFIREWKKNLGKGFVEFDFSEFGTDILFEPKGAIEKVIVLSDLDCGSSGDAFVEACIRSNKVTVVGRATAGITDYSNVATKSWDDQFELWYPTSKDKRIDIGKGLTGIGVLPDIHIPWTPEHIFEDIDLMEALLLCDTVTRNKA